MIFIDDEAPGDFGAREALLDRVMPDRATKPSERLREDAPPACRSSLATARRSVARSASGT